MKLFFFNNQFVLDGVSVYVRITKIEPNIANNLNHNHQYNLQLAIEFKDSLPINICMVI